MAWYGSLIFNFLSTFHTIFHTGYISLHYDQAFPFCHILTNQHFLLVICLIIAILTGVRSHIADFTLHLFDDHWCWVSFHVPIGHLYFFVTKMSIRSFTHLLTVFVILNGIKFLYFLDINSLLDISSATIFSHSVGWLFVLLTVSFPV